MDNPRFSIVIPVYNGLSHNLQRCLESIWSQNLDEDCYEVVCVDDLSSDGTLAWLRRQAAARTRLRIVENTENLRQGGARNRGVAQAGGEYVAFIDQDDYFHPGALAKAFETISGEGLDALVADNARETPSRPNSATRHNLPWRDVVTGDTMIAGGPVPFSPWNYLFRRSLMTDRGILFAERERIEDVDWVFRLLHAAERVGYLPLPLVHNTIEAASTTMTAHVNPDTVYSYFRASRRLHSLALAGWPADVARRVAEARELYFYWGLRQCFFFRDKARAKTAQITANCMEPLPAASPRALNRLARRFPALFARLSNLLSPAARLAMRAWRRLRYA